MDWGQRAYGRALDTIFLRFLHVPPSERLMFMFAQVVTGRSYVVTPFELFMGFSTYYNSLGITWGESIATHTGRIISYIDSLGRMLGYRIFSELSFSLLFDLANRKCPLEYEKKKPDVCWGYLGEDGALRYELALESEQSMDDEKIEKDLEKLLFFPSRLKVLYCAHDRPERVIDLVKRVAEDRQGFEGELLLIVDPWVSRKTFSDGKLTAILINSSLVVTHYGEADVAALEDGLFNIRLFKNAHWSVKRQ